MKPFGALSVAAIICFLASAVIAQPVPYTPGHSIGPVGTIADQVLEADLLTYAEAYWQFVDSGGQNTTLLEAFDPQSPNWEGDDVSPAAEIYPFAEGIALLRDIFDDKLQLDSSLGPIEDINTLIETDPVVEDAWREWTLYHQLTTNVVDDPDAHALHIDAIQEALGAGQDWSIIGVPYYSGTTLEASATITSHKLTKKRPGCGNYDPPTELDPQTLGSCAVGMALRIDGAKDALTHWPSPPNRLYAEDKKVGETGGPKSGFDCDDFADAWACHITKSACCSNCPPGCLQAKTLYMSWTDGTSGLGMGHLIVKVICCGRYWLVDPQTGNVSGPHAGDTIPNGYDLVKNDYDIGLSKSVTTSSDERDIGEREDVEPEPWHEDQDAIDHFESTTNLDASDFMP